MEMIKQASVEIISKVREMMPANNAVASKIIEDHSQFKLTQYTHGLGCACKIEPKKLEQILKHIQIIPHPDILVGIESSDDAAVYRINDNTAIVQTLDFFTPIVDDPYDFGAIAAANALSDIYAMGAKPLFALNIVGFPQNTLPMSVLERILKGASDKAGEAGISILGGHSIEDPEPKFGLVVTGIVHPDKIIRNAGAKKGDHIILTKPIGTGILSTAIKRGLTDEKVINKLVRIMSALNNISGEIMLKYNVSACTDVTGFGLIGHLSEMAEASSCDAIIEFDKIPFIKEAKSMAAAGVIPGGTYRNLDFFKSKVIFEGLSKTEQLLCCDAQTSGGLLIAIDSDEANDLIEELRKKGILESKIIGHFIGNGKGDIRVIR
jgi:selenide,water dikinase